MKRILILALMAVILIPALTLAARPIKGDGEPGGRVVILDPGHGGTETGAVNGNLVEKELNLQIAILAQKELEALGYTVHLTRTDNETTLSNADRYNFANAKKGNALVSIHLNSFSDPSVNGTETLYGKKSKDEAFARVMQSSLVNNLGTYDRGVKQFASGVLLKSNMPAVIAESVFMSNTEEAELLRSGTRQVQISNAITLGVQSWLK